MGADSSKLSQLVNAGFHEDEARAALDESWGNVASAEANLRAAKAVREAARQAEKIEAYLYDAAAIYIQLSHLSNDHIQEDFTSFKTASNPNSTCMHHESC